jgi:hypothetical protein
LRDTLNGLKQLSKDKNIVVVDKIANFLIEKSRVENEYYIRLAAASALDKFLLTKNEETNQSVFIRLSELLRDKRQRVKNNACTALADPDAKASKPDYRVLDSINELISVAEHDIDGFVRRVAKDTLNIIREWVKEWAEKPPKIDVKIREKENEKEKAYEITAIKGKEDHERRLEVIRKSVLEY